MKKTLFLMTGVAALIATATIFADDEQVISLKPGGYFRIEMNGQLTKITCENDNPRATLVPVKPKKKGDPITYQLILDKMVVETHDSLDAGLGRLKELVDLGIR